MEIKAAIVCVCDDDDDDGDNDDVDSDDGGDCVFQQVNTWRPELIELEDRAKQVS